MGEWGSIAYLRSEGRDERVNWRKLLAKARNNPDVLEILGIQRGRDGKAKAYQVRPFLTVFVKHGLSLE